MAVFRRKSKIKVEPVSAGSTKGKCRRAYVGDSLDLSVVCGSTAARYQTMPTLPVSRRI